MSVRALLKELEASGIEVRADGDGLEYEGPEDAVTPQLLDQLEQHKAELMELLRRDYQPGRIIPVDPVDQAARELGACGWQPKERCGKTIWQSPKNGFYYSQESALGLLERGAEACKFIAYRSSRSP